MYKKYFGLNKKPFDLCPDPNVVFSSEMHKEALAVLRYGVIDRKGFLLLTGDVGTGKTTLLQTLSSSLDTKVHLCLIANPVIAVNEFYYYICDKYGLGEYDGNKAKFMIAFSRFLKQCTANRERVLLVIDEAHVLPVDLLEEIRLLSNQEYMEYGIMSIFLVGQPELNKRLAHERLLPLRQRIGIRYHLEPFAKEDTKKYIFFRLRTAGAQKLDIFSENAINLIHLESKGVPRLINIVCDRALLHGFAENRPILNSRLIRECIKDLHIPGESSSLPLPDQAASSEGIKYWGPRVAISVALFLAVSLLLLVMAYTYGRFAPEDWLFQERIGIVQDELIEKGRILWERSIRR